MLTHRKKAKSHLIDASLTDFWQIVSEAKISKEDQKILDARFVEGLSIVSIAMELGYSPDHVKQVIQRAYDKVARLLE